MFNLEGILNSVKESMHSVGDSIKEYYQNVQRERVFKRMLATGSAALSAVSPAIPVTGYVAPAAIVAAASCGGDDSCSKDSDCNMDIGRYCDMQIGQCVSGSSGDDDDSEGNPCGDSPVWGITLTEADECDYQLDMRDDCVVGSRDSSRGAFGSTFDYDPQGRTLSGSTYSGTRITTSSYDDGSGSAVFYLCGDFTVDHSEGTESGLERLDQEMGVVREFLREHGAYALIMGGCVVTIERDELYGVFAPTDPSITPSECEERFLDH